MQVLTGKQFALEGARRAIETARLYLMLAAHYPAEEIDRIVSDELRAELDAVEAALAQMQEVHHVETFLPSAFSVAPVLDPESGR